jgi:hypothetical protein
MADDSNPVPTTSDDPMAGFAATIGRRINALERSLFDPLTHISVSMAEAGKLMIEQAARLDLLRAHQVRPDEVKREQQHLLHALGKVPFDATDAIFEMIGKVQEVQARNVEVLQQHCEEDSDAG